MAQSRITITIPADLVQAADARAHEEGRSRSWLLVEALRAYLSAHAYAAASSPSPALLVRDGLDPQRRAQLRADLALSPLERVELAEQTALVAEIASARAPRSQVLGFDRAVDFHAWERHEALAR